MATAITKPDKTWKSRLFNRPTRDYIHPYLGGLLLGLVLFLAFFLTGNGLGASGGLNRIVVFVQDLIAPAHVDRIPYLIKLAGGDKNPLDDWIVPMMVASSILSRRLSTSSSTRATAAVRLQNSHGRRLISPQGLVPNSEARRRSGRIVVAERRLKTPGSPRPDPTILSMKRVTSSWVSSRSGHTAELLAFQRWLLKRPTCCTTARYCFRMAAR